MPEVKLRHLTLEDFLAGAESSAYIRFRQLRVYVRKGPVGVDGKVLRAITRANTVSTRRGRSSNVDFNRRRRRTGDYQALDQHMRELAQQHGYHGVYVESVLNEFLPTKLEAWGYQQVNHSYQTANYWIGVTFL